MHVYSGIMRMQHLWEPEEGVISPRTRVKVVLR